MQIVNGLMLVVALAGVVLNVTKRWQGFLLWTVSNSYWAWYMWRLDERLAALQFAVFVGLCIYGMFAWRGSRLKTADSRHKRRAKGIITAKLSELSELTYQGDVNDAATIAELKRRLQANNIVTERLLWKLQGKRTRPIYAKTKKENKKPGRAGAR